jgi:hypothetical protein
VSFINDLLEKPANLSTASKYAVINGFIYLGIGALLIVWPSAVQTLLRDRAFVGDEGALFRVEVPPASIRLDCPKGQYRPNEFFDRIRPVLFYRSNMPSAVQ